METDRIIELKAEVEKHLKSSRGREFMLMEAYSSYESLLHVLRRQGYDVDGHIGELLRIKNDIKTGRFSDAHKEITIDFDSLRI